MTSLDRIVVLSDISWPLGGAEILALLNARLMAEAGYRVAYITGDNGARCPLDREQFDFLACGGAQLLDRPKTDSGLKGLYDHTIKAKISEYIARTDTPNTVYHLHNWSQIFSPSIFHALAPVLDRLFISAHDFGLACPNQSYSNYQRSSEVCALKPLSLSCVATHCDKRAYSHKLWRVARQMVLRQTMNLVSTPARIAMIHPFMLEYFERAGIAKDRLCVVRNPVNPFSKQRIEAEKNSDIFFIGRLVQEKGVDLAAEAARRVGRRLQVIGDGALRDSLASQYPDAIFHGFRNHGEISQLIGAARALLVPSRLPETFTLVAHEAMRSGIPVVAFDDVDGVEAARIGAAIVVPPREAQSLADGLRRLDDDAATARMSQLAFDEGWRFSNTAKTWRDALVSHYRELLDTSAKTRA